MKAQDPRLYPTPAESGQKAAGPRVVSAADIGIIPSKKGNLHYISSLVVPNLATSRTGAAPTLSAYVVRFGRAAMRSPAQVIEINGAPLKERDPSGRTKPVGIVPTADVLPLH